MSGFYLEEGTVSILADHNLPFAVALALMVVLAIVQLIGLGGFDFDADGEVDLDLDADSTPGAMSGLLSIIGVGRVPFMIWLALFLFIFAAMGVSIQSLAASLTGAPLDILLGAVIAGAAALPVTGILSRPLAHILPGDETSAVHTDSLLGRRARIAIGRAVAGSPARAIVHDLHGQTHNVMVEPHDPAAEMLEGDEVLLVRREGEIFFCIATHDRRLAPG
jgi:hypothetical protein